MTVAFFTGYTTWRPHYETELELIQRHLDAGDHVIQLGCSGEMLACDANIFHSLATCRECRGNRTFGLELVSGNVVTRRFLSLHAGDRKEIARLPAQFADVEALKVFKVEDFDIGYAVLSSIVSTTRDHLPDFAKFGNLPGRFMASSLAVYRSMQNFLGREKVDRVYVFNGRFAASRAVLRACQSRGVDCFIHERGHNIHHYALYPNALPHDLAATEQIIRGAWARAEGDPRREELASKFYLDREAGVIQSWHSFVSQQQKDTLPTDWDPARRNVVVFNSSEDEFASIGDSWRNPVYGNQEEALTRIIGAFEETGAPFHLYLRCHPNLRTVENSQVRFLRGLRSPILTVIPPESSVSTYALLRHADKVISFGSTVGIEAAYWGRPSILAGRSFYRNLGSTFNPDSHEELMTLVRSTLAPKDRTGALMYGFHLNTFGEPFRHYAAKGVVSGTFKGVWVGARPTLCARIRDSYSRLVNRLFNLHARWLVTGRLRRLG